MFDMCYALNSWFGWVVLVCGVVWLYVIVVLVLGLVGVINW